MPIIGEKILEVSGRKDKAEGFAGLSINIAIEGVKVEGENIEMKYDYTANYEEKMGQISIKGILIAKEDKKLTDSVRSEWAKNQKLPNDYAENILSAINYSGSANGTLIARVLGLAAPHMPQRITLPKAK
jgi:hypothetical protein